MQRAKWVSVLTETHPGRHSEYYSREILPGVHALNSNATIHSSVSLVQSPGSSSPLCWVTETDDGLIFSPAFLILQGEHNLSCDLMESEDLPTTGAMMSEILPLGIHSSVFLSLWQACKIHILLEGKMKNGGLESDSNMPPGPASPLLSYVTVDKLLNLFKLWFSDIYRKPPSSGC